jgi:hypothetical protein
MALTPTPAPVAKQLTAETSINTKAKNIVLFIIFTPFDGYLQR